MDNGIGILPSETVECVSRYLIFPAYRRYGFSAVQHSYYFAAVVDKSLQFRVASFLASEYDALFASKGQRLACPHGYQVSFYFRYQSECETEHLAVYGVVEGVSVFGAV